MKKIVLLICLIGGYCYSQNQASNWFFGENAGINFNVASNSVSALINGQLNTREGCASISDREGNFLFYTDGSTIWNKNHEIMMNGTGLFGDASSTQSAIILPKPGDPNIYFVFTVDDVSFEDEILGLNYSVVDLKLDGGLGAVRQKNINLLSKCSEKLTAVLKDCESESLWIVTFASEDGTQEIYNTYHAFEVSTFGVNNNSVKSTFPSLNITDGRGYLKLSPDGKLMASANVKDGMLLYDFDANSGVVSNERRLIINSSSNFPYGVEFSPNSKLLYVNSSNDFFNPELNSPENHFCTLSQFDLSQTFINNSETILDQRQLYRGALQLGPDGKIYRALSSTYNDGLPFLGVIDNPNAVGVAANYIHNGISLGNTKSAQGLPPFISSFFNSEIDIIKNGDSSISLSLCEGDIYTLAADDILGATYEWSRDGIPLSEDDFDLEITISGEYKVIVTVSDEECPSEGQAFVTFYPFPESISHSLLQCEVDGILDGLTVYNLEDSKSIFTDGKDYLSTKFYTDSTRLIEITDLIFYNTQSPQTIYVTVTNDLSGCSGDSELILGISNTNIDNVNFPSVCDNDGVEDGIYRFNLEDIDPYFLDKVPAGSKINYYRSIEDASLEQNILRSPFANTSQYSQTIYARAENDNNCYGIGEVLLTINPLPNIETEILNFYCLNRFPETTTLDAGITNDSTTNYSFLWSTGETTENIEINSPGIYKVEVTNANGCSKIRTITVESSNIASFNSPPYLVKDLSSNNMISVFVSGQGTYQYALFNEKEQSFYRGFQNNNIFENVFPGVYTIFVKDIKNDCGIIDISVSVVGFPKFFTPNNDGFNDFWQVYGVSEMFQQDSKILIFNRFGKLIKQLDPLGPGWDGTFNGTRLQSDDYWFSVTLQDGTIFKNHFTLKR